MRSYQYNSSKHLRPLNDNIAKGDHRFSKQIREAVSTVHARFSEVLALTKQHDSNTGIVLCDSGDVRIRYLPHIKWGKY